MNKVRTAKVATVDEVKAKVDATSTAVVTEYRGMTVAQISALRRQLRTLDADYKVFKNTLVRRAIAGTAVEPLDEFLDGPDRHRLRRTATSRPWRRPCATSPRRRPTLVVKGGVLDGKALSVERPDRARRPAAARRPARPFRGPAGLAAVARWPAS